MNTSTRVARGTCLLPLFVIESPDMVTSQAMAMSTITAAQTAMRLALSACP
jgi:hypothetical protein